MIQTPTIKVQEVTDYYEDYRGPVLHVTGELSNVKMTYIPADELEDDYDDQECIDDFLPLFSATIRGKDKQSIVLSNEGTTAIRYQWLRFPANGDAKFWLINPQESTRVGETSKTGLRDGTTEEKIAKRPCFQFRFREMPNILLPGQTHEFPITFRSTTTGYFYENLYLLTHPRLQDFQGRGYSLKLTGICMNPDLLEKYETDARNIQEEITRLAIEEEAKDLMNTILDHAVHSEPNVTSSLLPLSYADISFSGRRIPSDYHFYAHNQHLQYHAGAAEQCLSSVQELVGLLIPQERLQGKLDWCPQSIEKLYRLLLKRSGPLDFNDKTLKSPTAEELLQNISRFTNKLTKPRRFHYLPKEKRKEISTQIVLETVTSGILKATEDVEDLLGKIPSSIRQHQDKVETQLQTYDILQTVTEEIIEKGIEKIISLNQIFDEMEDYRQSNFYASTSNSSNVC